LPKGVPFPPAICWSPTKNQPAPFVMPVAESASVSFAMLGLPLAVSSAPTPVPLMQPAPVPPVELLPNGHDGPPFPGPSPGQNSLT
jgi:hypothetical protein